jgi:hypothetical protein
MRTSRIFKGRGFRLQKYKGIANSSDKFETMIRTIEQKPKACISATPWVDLQQLVKKTILVYHFILPYQRSFFFMNFESYFTPLCFSVNNNQRWR